MTGRGYVPGAEVTRNKAQKGVNERFLGKNFANSKNRSIFALAFGKGALLYTSKAHFYQGPIRLSARTQDFHS